jgi:hypothetical protein
MGESSTEDQNVARANKSLTVPEQLNTLIEAVQRATGATFTRLATAALLKYVFGELVHPEELNSIRITSGSGTWMNLAYLLEKDQLEVGKIVDELLDAAQRDAHFSRRVFPVGQDSTDEQRENDALAVRRIEACARLRELWALDLKESNGNPIEAIVARIRWEAHPDRRKDV